MSLGLTTALPSCQPAAPCPPCIFGAATSLHSYPDHLETVTVQVIPLVTPLRNGSLETSYLTTTLTEDVPGTQLPVSQFTDPSAVTWTISNSIVLTWPTTYVQYTNFYGAPGTAAPITQNSSLVATSTCAQWSAVRGIPTPPTPDVAPFVVPLTSNASSHYDYWPSNPVPTGILTYMEGLSWVISFMGDDDLATCSATIGPTVAHQTMPCTTESISTITTCQPTTRLNATVCPNTITETKVVVTLGVPSNTRPVTVQNSSIGPTTSATSRAPGPVAPGSFPSAPPYSSYRAGGTPTASVTGTTPTPFPYSSAAPVSHETVHLLTTITQPAITIAPSGFGVSNGPDPGLSDVPIPGSSDAATGVNYPYSPVTNPLVTSQDSSAPGSGAQPLLQSDQQVPPIPATSNIPTLLIGTRTLPPGVAITDSGTVYSYPSAGASLFINGSPASISGPRITIGNSIVSVLSLPPSTLLPPPSPELVAGTRTLSPGSAITLAGTTLSLPSSPRGAGTVWINGTPTRVPPNSILTVGGIAFTLTSQAAISAGAETAVGLAEGSQTVLPGGVVTADGGETVSVPASAGIAAGASVGTVYVDGRPTVFTGSEVTVGTEIFSVVTATQIITAAATGRGSGSGDGGAIFRASGALSTTKKGSAIGGMAEGWKTGLAAVVVGLFVTGVIVL